MERERSIQDAAAKAENQVLTFKSDESFTQAVGAMIELVNHRENGRISLASILLEKGIRFEVKQVR